MFAERLKQARSAAGLSMRDLAEQVGVSANMIKKYEHGDSMPSSAVLLQLGRALGVRSEYFFRPFVLKLGEVEYRKRSTAPQKILNRIKGEVLDQAERWYELKNLWPEFPLPSFAMPIGLPERIETLEHVEAFSLHLRDAWSLGLDAIPKLIDLLESQGVLVIGVQQTESKIDGLQASIAGSPVIVVAADTPGDRQRFTLAHELGHLLLQGRLDPGLNEEMACNRFAGAFLLPASTMQRMLGAQRRKLEMRELYLLKQEFGLSMAACLYRAKDLHIIEASLYQQLQRRFSMNGWRTLEPGEPYPQENTTLFSQLVYRALGEGLIGDAKAAELLGITAYAFHQERKMEWTHAVADQRCQYPD